MRTWALAFALVTAIPVCPAASLTVKTHLCSPSRLQTGVSNANLEAIEGNGFVGWSGNHAGYEVEGRFGHSGRASARCTNASADEKRGLAHPVEFGQVTPTPIVIEAWSKADRVVPGLDPLYALYVDLACSDGTAYRSGVSRFATGTHDWQRVTVTIIPTRPLRSAWVYGLFRNCAGTAWFDDIQVWSTNLPAATQYFDAFPVATPPLPAAGPAAGPGLTIADGLTLQFDPRTGQPLFARPGGLLLRDAETMSDFVQPAGKLESGPEGALRFQADDEALKLRLTANYRLQGEALRIDGEVKDLTGTDRAVTVYFTYPVDALGWQWHDDQRVSRRIVAGEDYGNYVAIQPGANGRASRHPFACLTGPRDGLVLGAPLDVPRLCRFGYNAGSRELFAAIDLGLAPDTAGFPSAASFSLILYRCDPSWGFRSALARYYELFPRLFTKRVKQEGLWLASTDSAPIEGIADLGLQFKSPNDSVRADARQGLSSFVYVEPMSLWLWMPTDMERTRPRAMALLEEKAAAGGVECRAAATSAVADANGEWDGGPTDLPWCKGYFFSMSPQPSLAAAGGSRTQPGRLLERIDYAIRRADNLRGAWDNWNDGGSLRQNGYALAPGKGRSGSCALSLTREADEDSAGAIQRVVLNQERPLPITARVWTKAVGVTGANDQDYALHVSAEYTDGTAAGILWVWARAGDPDWQLLEKTVTPAKPVRAVVYHLLFRRPHTGGALFDDGFLADEGTGRNLLGEADFEVSAGAPRATIAGTYIDSLNVWWGERNYRRDQWAGAQTPLVFDSEGRPCQWMVFPTVEFVRSVAERMHAQDKLTFANGAVVDQPWAAPWLDILAYEANWIPDGHYVPDPDWLMNYRRALSYQRPFLLLSHAAADEFKPEWIEAFVKRCTAYGIFPSPGDCSKGAYWATPAWYNRDRPLWRKYVPVIRTLSAAGWEPITCARSENPQVYVERFGRPDAGVYLTLLNDSDRPQSTRLSLEAAALGLGAGDTTAIEVLRDERLPLAGGQLAVAAIEPGGVRVLKVGRQADGR